MTLKNFFEWTQDVTTVSNNNIIIALIIILMIIVLIQFTYSLFLNSKKLALERKKEQLNELFSFLKMIGLYRFYKEYYSVFQKNLYEKLEPDWEIIEELRKIAAKRLGYQASQNDCSSQIEPEVAFENDDIDPNLTIESPFNLSNWKKHPLIQVLPRSYLADLYQLNSELNVEKFEKLLQKVQDTFTKKPPHE